MMNNSRKPLRSRFSIAVFNHTNYSYRYITIPPYLILAGFLILVTMTAITVYLSSQANQLEKSTKAPQLLKRQIAEKKKQSRQWKQHLNALQNQINHLDNKLASLETLETKIQTVGRLEPTVNHENFFGIGGDKNKVSPPKADASAAPEASIGKTHNNIKKGLLANDLCLQAGNRSHLTLILKHTDFEINPITGIPALIPASGSIQNNFTHTPSATEAPRKCRRGLIVSPEKDSDIVAPASGIITYTGHTNASEKILIINHGHGYVTRYIGLARICKKAGQNVSRGETIGTINKKTWAKNSSTANFYYEILLNGLPVNPENYLAQGAFLL